MSDFVCGAHTAVVYLRGGQTVFGELTPLTAVHWQRIRDDISQAQVTVGTTDCCDLLDELRVIKHELHIYRNGVKVWQGPITRLEYDYNQVTVFAEDVMWLTSRTVIREGYSNAYPNIGYALDRVHWLLSTQCFNLDGDPWHVFNHLHPMNNPGANPGPKTSRAVNRYQMTVFDDLDNFASHGGIDYVCVNREVYYNDTHLARFTLPTLDEQYMSQFPRIIEYGMQLATQCVVTDGAGHGVDVEGPGPWSSETEYGRVDSLISLVDDQTVVDDTAPTDEELDAWRSQATRVLNNRAPAPLSVLIPENTTLLPGAPWEINDIIPGAWFMVHVTRMCRQVDEFQKLVELVVEESAPNGETVNFSAASAPLSRIDPTP